MDASASQGDPDFKKVCGFLLNLDNNSYPAPIKQNKPVIKYTKLPDFDFDSNVSWPQQSYTLQPRLRRIIGLDDERMLSSRSLKNDLETPLRLMSSSITNRKIVTITEDEENDLHPKFARDTKKSGDLKKDREPAPRSTSRLTPSSRYSKDIKPSAKINTSNKSKDKTTTKMNQKTQNSNISSITQTFSENSKARSIKDKETARYNRSGNTSAKSSISKNLLPPSKSEKELCLVKKKKIDGLKSYTSPRKAIERPRPNNYLPQNDSKLSILTDIKSKNRPVNVIHVPLEPKYQNVNIIETEVRKIMLQPLDESMKISQIDCSTEVERNINTRDINVGTDPEPVVEDRNAEIEKKKLKTIIKTDSNTQTDIVKDTFDSLDIPNVTLIKDKSEIPKEDVVKFFSQSVPNLQVPQLKVAPIKDETSDQKSLCKSSSYIISRATLTYTTRQKINFQVVGNNKEAPNLSSSPLAYPMNVVSVFKQEMKNREISEVNTTENTQKKNDKPNIEYTNCLNEMKSLNCSYVFDSTKLVKPSDIISTITVNNHLLQSDYICEQFQRELNFIDSFFESLQYLESCSLSEKCFLDNKVENWVGNSGFDVKNPEYDSFFSRLENGANIDDTETMASKSLCLLNLLIRDEQRRAKNLLFVLKMREDALKDFTKSQILWLENKKKQENTDVSTLKKKQRGALLKLQHECGEMQRMRKALLALSEKRKVALMKTKKNIELSLRSHVSVDQIFLSKKKLKRTASIDRHTAPLKCFDLSSSGCDESTTSRPKSDVLSVAPAVSTPCTRTNRAEKCIQTSDSVLEADPHNQSTDTAAENFVVVDGGYLNIIFHNLSLPQIFSRGKQYEVNEEALKNIVNSTNSHYRNFSEGNVVEKFMDQIKNRDLEKSSTPSTARSLVEEFDQYYKVLTADEKSPIDSPQNISADESREEQCDISCQSTIAMTNDNAETILKTTSALGVDLCDFKCSLVTLETRVYKGRDSSVDTISLTMPLPEVTPPVASVSTPNVYLVPKSPDTYNTPESSVSSESLCPGVPSMLTLSTPAQCEAEELRRQQLAIEREIKALEQQQCQLLVVREIPDKPPPPYTPPTELRAPKLPRIFTADETTEERIHKNITQPNNDADPTDIFDIFVNDFCQEMSMKQKSRESDKPWDACNLLPQKPQANLDTLVKKTSEELKEILTGVKPSVSSGVGARRADHIDDILFAEWRRCEPEWTSLHTDEAIVKNQIFESIFQKILTETIDQYKKTVNNEVPNEELAGA